MEEMIVTPPKNEQKETAFSCKNFKAEALNQLKRRWTTPVLVSLCVFVLFSVIFAALYPWEFYINLIKTELNVFSHSDFDNATISELTDASGIWGPFARITAMYFIFFLAFPPFAVASLYIYPILFKQKEPVKFSDFICGFSLWGKAIGAFFYKLLWLYLWMLVPIAPCYLIMLILVIVLLAIKVSETSLIVICCTIAILMAIACYSILFIKLYSYSQMEFALVDYDKVRVTQSMKISKEITKGYKWKLFVLDLSFIGWGLLCSIIPVGQIWLQPYMNSTKYVAYRFLLSEYNKKQEAELTAEISDEYDCFNKGKSGKIPGVAVQPETKETKPSEPEAPSTEEPSSKE